MVTRLFLDWDSFPTKGTLDFPDFGMVKLHQSPNYGKSQGEDAYKTTEHE